MRVQGSPWSHVPLCWLLTATCCGEPWLGVCWGLGGDTEVPPCSEREDGHGQTGLHGAHLPSPFLTWLTPGQLNHTAGAQCGLVISPGSLPPLLQGHSPHFQLPVGCSQSLWQAGLEEAGCATSCADIHCRTLMITQQHSPGATEAGDQSLGSWTGALVMSDLLPDAEVSRRAIPCCGHSVPGLVPLLIPRGGICPCFSHLIESSVHTNAVPLVASSQPRSSHKTTQRVLALVTLPVLAKLRLSQTETPPDPAHCQQVPRLSVSPSLTVCG